MRLKLDQRDSLTKENMNDTVNLVAKLVCHFEQKKKEKERVM